MLVICDRRVALLPLASATDQRWTIGVLVVHPSRLLDGWVALFEDHWGRAVGLNSALARHLGISPRTLNRRIIRLMALLGAGSRFRAGIQAAKHGLL